MAVSVIWNKNVIINTFDKKYHIVDMHSVGLAKIIGMELQYVVPKDAADLCDVKNNLFKHVANNIANKRLELVDGTEFKVRQYGNIKFRFMKAKDKKGNDVMRIVECDACGKFPDDPKCGKTYKYQLNPLPEVS